MNNSFDQRVDRSGDIFWLKDVFTPDAVRKAGLVAYAGAEFEFSTCPAFCRGVQEAAAKGLFGYALAQGKYLERVQWWMHEMRNWQIEPEWVVPTHGTIFSLATTIRLFTEPGERIIVPVPGYNRYEQAATRLNRGTVLIPLSEQSGQYTMDWNALEQAMAEDTNKILVLCNPNNPTGHLYTEQELRRIADLSRQYQVAVFSDEIFAEVVFEGKRAIPYVSVAGTDALAITCTSLGKAFSLTGVNHANLIITNPALREKMIAQRDADHYGSVDPMLYAGLISAYTPEGARWVRNLTAYVWENYRLLERFIKENLPGAVVTEPEGTFVVWVDYKNCSVAPEMIEQYGLFHGDEGGEYFGKPSCVRYSMAVPRRELERSLTYLKQTLRSL